MPDHRQLEDIEEPSYTKEVHSPDRRQSNRRGSQAFQFNAKHLFRDVVTSRRKMIRQSIWGVFVFYIILLCLGSIVLYVLFHLYDDLVWRMHKPPEKLPPPRQPSFGRLKFDHTFDTSLSCSQAPIFNRTLLRVPPGSEVANAHIFTLVGGASSLIILATSPDPAEENIVYDIVLMGNVMNAQLVSFIASSATKAESTTMNTSFLNISTPTSDSLGEVNAHSNCVRMEITLFIPRSLKKLALISQTVTHLTFAPDAHISLDDLIIDISSQVSSRNLILGRESVHAKNMSLRSNGGWIAGELSLTEQLTIENNGTTKITIVPSASSNINNPSAAVLQTVTGSDMELIYKPSKAYRRRPIHSSHRAINPAELILEYTPANFSGLLDLRYPISYTPNILPLSGTDNSISPGQWTHFFGEQKGVDTLQIRSPLPVALLL